MKLPPVTMPTSDLWYAAVVNATHYITGYLPNYVPASTRLITDLTAVQNIPPVGTPIVGTQAMWQSALNALWCSYHFPTPPLVGTYRSARTAAPSWTNAWTYPPRWNTLENYLLGETQQGIASQAVFPGLQMIDYRQGPAADKLVADVVSGVVATGMPLAFLDEVSSNELDARLPPWITTMAVLGRIVSGLHSAGMRVLANCALHLGTTTPVNIAAFLGTSIDGISLEEAFPDPSVRRSATAIATAVGQFRQLLDAGLTVVMIPDPNNYPNDSMVLAAWGMMFRAPGDRLFVNMPFYLTSVPSWANWPASFGAPTGPYTQTTDASGAILLSRTFAAGQISLNTFTGVVTTH